jgi:hypothetical protein
MEEFMHLRITTFLSLLVLLVMNQYSFALQAPVSLQDLAEQSDKIVRGRIMKLTYSQETNSYGDELIYTHATVRVAEALKGDRTDLVVKIEGGTLNGITLTVSDTTAFQTGEEVLVFLKKDVLEYRPLTRFSSKYTISSDGRVLQNGRQYTSFRTDILRAVHDRRVR